MILKLSLQKHKRIAFKVNKNVIVAVEILLELFDMIIDWKTWTSPAMP